MADHRGGRMIVAGRRLLDHCRDYSRMGGSSCLLAAHTRLDTRTRIRRLFERPARVLKTGPGPASVEDLPV